MVTFSKFLTGHSGSKQLIDPNGYTYNLRKGKTTPDGCSTWRCSNNRSLKCPCNVYFIPAEESLPTGPKEHKRDRPWL